MKNIAIILAAGSSQRCGFDKLFSSKHGKMLVAQTCEIFERCRSIDEIVLVVAEKNKEKAEQMASPQNKIQKVILGGSSRYLSLTKACKSFSEKTNARIIVHNGANPHLKIRDLENGIALAKEKKNVIFGFFTTDSIKKVINGKVEEFLNRDEIFQTQTPQISDLKTFRNAIESVEKNANIRDEAELLNTIDEEIFVYECCPSNQKITFETDFQTLGNGNLRIGVGEDSHRFTETFDKKFPVILGGIPFPEVEKSFDANSDGDVVLHAVCNAILSSVGEKTLDSFANEMCRNGIADSEHYVKKSLKIARDKCPQFEIKNLAISLEGKYPKIAPRHDEIVKNCAKILEIKEDQIGLTYTSGEGLNEYGKGFGVRCFVEGVMKI